MHIILGVLGTLVTILVLLNRLQDAGIDIGWLNPFSWARRRAFRLQYNQSPAYTLSSPMDVAALLMFAVAKADGDITREQKEGLLALFESEFHLTANKAQELLGASAHLYGNGEDVKSNPKAVVARSLDAFTAEQVESVVGLLNKVSQLDGTPSNSQRKLVDSFTAVLPKSSASKW